MGRATMDRCLQPARFESHQGFIYDQTRHIAQTSHPSPHVGRMGDTCPGFLEMDLVAHCGDTTEGQYLNTLTATDIATGWTECLPLARKTQQEVSQAILALSQHLPFPLLGIDSDNCNEFINDTLYRYCLTEQITFTHLRPYRKNDQAHVEQKTGQWWAIPWDTTGSKQRKK